MSSSLFNFDNPAVIVLGPEASIVTKYDNKIFHFTLFEKLKIPHVEYKFYEASKDLLNIRGFPFYISGAYSAGGMNSAIINNEKELNNFLDRLNDINKNQQLIVNPFISEVIISPNINAVVCDKNDTKIICITDQILQGNTYLGNIYPSVINQEQRNEIIDITKKIGNYFSLEGFKGLFGLDFLIDSSGKVYCVDINPRRQGGYLCNILVSKRVNIPALELKLVLGEPTERFNDEDFNIDYVWAHSKIPMNGSRVKIIKSFKSGNILDPFNKIGPEFKAIFYDKGNYFTGVGSGYIALSGNNHSEVKQRIFSEMKNLAAECYLNDR
jgi:predicted ATP-grasp superfamily ATP-dependent carboligase